MNSDWTWPWKWCCARKGKMRYLIFSLDFLWGTQKPKWRKGSCHTTNNPIFGQGASARGAMWEQAKYFTISLTRTCTMSSAGETVYLNLATRRFTLYVRGRHKLDGTAVSIFVNSTNITTNIETAVLSCQDMFIIGKVRVWQSWNV